MKDVLSVQNSEFNELMQKKKKRELKQNKPTAGNG